MNDFTGRRNTGRAKRIASSIVDGLSALNIAMADGPKIARIEEIDQTIADLQQERDHLVLSLIDLRDYTVSDKYDPHWRKPEVKADKPLMDHYFGEKQDAGRLTQCKGRRTMSSYHDAHPGCPYVGQIHNAHEFTLRD